MSLDAQKLRSQLYMIERATRALRVHMEEQQEVQGQTGWAALKTPLKTGLEGLLTASNDIPAFTPKSHERFYPGVWFGYVADREDFGIEVRTRCHPATDQGQLLADEGSSALIADVSCKSDAEHLWLTLETGLDTAEVIACQSLEARFILSFINNSPFPLGQVGMQLGLSLEDGFRPEFKRYYPALDVPLELSYTVTADQLLGLPREGVKSLNLMMTLPVPVTGSYTAILSHFEVSVTKRASI